MALLANPSCRRAAHGRRWGTDMEMGSKTEVIGGLDFKAG